MDARKLSKLRKDLIAFLDAVVGEIHRLLRPDGGAVLTRYESDGTLTVVASRGERIDEKVGARATVTAPIVVNARRWGAMVAAWRDSKVFTDAERAALELAEQGTRIADGAGGVTDEAWANAAKHYDSEQLAALTCMIAVINAYNRLNVISGNQGGDYVPGQWG